MAVGTLVCKPALAPVGAAASIFVKEDAIVHLHLRLLRGWWPGDCGWSWQKVMSTL